MATFTGSRAGDDADQTNLGDADGVLNDAAGIEANHSADDAANGADDRVEKGDRVGRRGKVEGVTAGDGNDAANDTTDHGSDDADGDDGNSEIYGSGLDEAHRDTLLRDGYSHCPLCNTYFSPDTPPIRFYNHGCTMRDLDISCRYCEDCDMFFPPEWTDEEVDNHDCVSANSSD